MIIPCAQKVEKEGITLRLQPFDQALREPGWNGLLLLGMGYNISGNPTKLWVRVLRQILTIMLICHDCTTCFIRIDCLLCALGGKRKPGSDIRDARTGALIMGYRCSLGYSSFKLLQIDNWPG